MGIEGELRLCALRTGGRVSGTRISSTRPDVAKALLQGRQREQIIAALPRLFTLCGHGQAAAGALACAAAAGEAVAADTRAALADSVAQEALRESARAVLLDWPHWVGEKADSTAVAAMCALMAAQPDRAALERALFGMDAHSWLALSSMSTLRRWADCGATAAARLLAREFEAAMPAGRRSPAALPGTRLLEADQHAEWVGALAQSIDADPAFANHPTWCGVPAETGPLARLQHDPLVHLLLQRGGTRVPARLVARLRELARLLCGHTTLPVGALALRPGHGVAWVENARGLLVHRVTLDGEGRALSYRIVVPTDWNFHPAGAVSLALAGSTCVDGPAFEQRAKMIVRSLDPCVSCHVEVADA